MTRTINNLKIAVDYSLTLEQMIAVGKYDIRDDELTAQRFPIVGKGKKELTAHLIWYPGFSMRCAGKELRRIGLRPGTIEELLAFGARFPEMQRECLIAGLGSVAKFEGHHLRVPYIGEFDSQRDVGLHSIDLGWEPTYWLLGFPM